MRLRTLPLLLAGITALGACDYDVSGPDGDEDATITGRVERPASPPGVAAQTTGTASIVAVASVNGDGSLTDVAEAQVEADGTFRVEGVPVGRTDLVVSARSESASEVGRVLVHAETRSGEEVVVAPIVPETTVEARLYGMLRAGGDAAVAGHTGGLAVFVRLDGPSGMLVLGSDADLQAMASAFAAAESWMTAGADELQLGLDLATRAELAAQAASTYAVARDAGTPLQAAHDDLVEATVDLYLSSEPAGPEGLALATAAYMTAAVDATESASATLRLAAARQTAIVNLVARMRLAAEVDGAPGETRASLTAALETAHAQVLTASSVAEVRAALEGAEASVHADLLAELYAEAGVIDSALELAIANALADVFAGADLAAELEAAATAGEAATVVGGFRAGVESDLDALVEVLSGVVELDTEAMLDVVLAATAHGSVGS